MLGTYYVSDVRRLCTFYCILTTSKCVVRRPQGILRSISAAEAQGGPRHRGREKDRVPQAPKAQLPDLPLQPWVEVSLLPSGSESWPPFPPGPFPQAVGGVGEAGAKPLGAREGAPAPGSDGHNPGSASAWADLRLAPHPATQRAWLETVPCHLRIWDPGVAFYPQGKSSPQWLSVFLPAHRHLLTSYPYKLSVITLTRQRPMGRWGTIPGSQQALEE